MGAAVLPQHTWTRMQTKPSLSQAAFRAASWCSPWGHSATMAPPLPVNFAAAACNSRGPWQGCSGGVIPACCVSAIMVHECLYKATLRYIMTQANLAFRALLVISLLSTCSAVRRPTIH